MNQQQHNLETFRQLDRLDKYRTNHIFHLIMCILTAGLWSVFWILCAVSNANERRKCNKRLDDLAKVRVE